MATGPTGKVTTLPPPAEDVEEVREEVHEEVHKEPPASLFELTLFFSQQEIDRMEEDALFLTRKGALKLPSDAGQASRIDAFVRKACAHTHGSIQKLLSSDMEAVDQVKKVAEDVQTLKGTYEQRNAELDSRERGIAEKEEKLEELMVKWLALQKEEE